MAILLSFETLALKIPTRWNGLDLKLKENVCKRNKCT